MSEKLLGAIKGMMILGWRGWRDMAVLFTENRIVVVQTGSVAKTILGSVGGTLGGELGALGAEALCDKAVRKKKHFAIDNSELVEICLNPTNLMKVKTKKKEYEFYMEGIRSKYVNVLKRCVAPEKLVIKEKWVLRRKQ